MARELGCPLAVGTTELEPQPKYKAELIRAYINKDAKVFSRLLGLVPNIADWMIAHDRVDTYTGDISKNLLDILNRKTLSLSQLADVEGSTGGVYVPEADVSTDLFKMDIEDDIPELIRLYRKVRHESVQSDALAEFLDVEPTEELRQITNIRELGDKRWRLNNLYTIINKKHKTEIMSLNNAQEYVLTKLEEHPRLAILKSRQRGISTFMLMDELDTCLTEPNKQLGLQAENMKTAYSLLRKAKLAYGSIPNEVKPLLVYSNSTEMEFSNGSKISIATSFRGSTLAGLGISELGRISLDRERSAELVSGTLPALPKNKATQLLLESTSEGGQGLFFDLFTTAQESYKPGTRDYSQLLPIFIGWAGIIESGVLIKGTEDPDCMLEVPEADDSIFPVALEEHLITAQKILDYTFTPEQLEWSIAEYRNLGSDIAEFRREYPLTIEDAWSSNTDGLILAEAFQMATVNKMMEVDLKHPIYAASDLGVDDTCATVFFQYYNGKAHVFAEYLNNSQAISHYTRLILDNNVAIWVLPHDANNRGAATAQKVVTHVRQSGFSNYRVLKQTRDLWADISSVRAYMPNIVFGNVEQTISSMKGYRKKWSAVTGQYLDTPLHDDNSHVADAVRYMVRFINTYL